MVTFYLDKRPDKNGEQPIRVAARGIGGRLLTSIGYSIDAASWDLDARRVKPGTKKAPTFNARGIPATVINARIKAIEAAFAKLEAVPGAATLESLKKALSEITGNERNRRAETGTQEGEQSEVFYYFDKFFKEGGTLNQWAAGTVAKKRTFRKSLESFKPDATFADFDEDGITKYIEDQREQGLEEKSVQARYGELRWFLRWAIRKGYCTETAIQRYRPKFKIVSKPVIFLTRDELRKLYDYKIPANQTKVKLKDHTGREYEKIVEKAGALEKARDLFCFCAATSLRYSDMAALKRSDIGENSIVVTTQKTHDRLEIPMNDRSRAILKKYEDLHDPRGLALPVISNQKMNDYLKDLCELCDFRTLITRVCYRNGARVEDVREKWALISTHAARRTFICDALTRGVAPQVVMKFTGHADYQAMKPYIDIAEADAFKAMQLLND